MKFFQVLCYCNYTTSKINASKVIPYFSSFLYTEERRNTMDTLITVTNSLSQVLAPKQKLSAILFLSCVHLPLLICVLFLFLAIWWHVHFFNHFTLASLTNLTLFFSHIQAVHPTHFNILLFLPVPVLKSCHFLSVPKAKNFILTSLSIATCSLL